MGAQRVLIYLLRRDLRLSDNPVFHEIHKLSQLSQRPFTHVLPLYVFPAQQVEVSGFLSDPGLKSPYPEARSETGKFWRCGPHRAKFLVESVWDLKLELKSVGSDLVVRVGLLCDVVKDLFEQFSQEEEFSVSALWMTEEEGVEEKREERAVRSAAAKASVDFKLWLDEKYFIDEYAWFANRKLNKTDPPQPRFTFRQTFTSSRRVHKLSKVCRTIERCAEKDSAHSLLSTLNALVSPVTT